MIRLTITCSGGDDPRVAHLDRAAFGLPAFVPWALYAGLRGGGLPSSIQEVRQTLKERQFDVNFLMIIAATRGGDRQPREGAVLMFLFSLNTSRQYARGRTHASIRALLDMAPKEADVYRDGQIVRVPVDDLQVGEGAGAPRRAGAGRWPGDQGRVGGERGPRSPASRCRWRSAWA
ncbi:hypothetical protein [Kouleothrix sp.]|uniref:hypothetical protein n=1 Tax=Kouleothrix sp. TaxID=2779161 RepID=UPI003918E711